MLVRVFSPPQRGPSQQPQALVGRGAKDSSGKLQEVMGVRICRASPPTCLSWSWILGWLHGEPTGGSTQVRVCVCTGVGVSFH